MSRNLLRPATLAALALLLPGCAPTDSEPGASSRPVSPRPVASVAERAKARPPLVVIALDGADWTMLDPLVAAGRMPELARLLSQGRRFTLTTEHPPLSPILWTTIATGVSPLEHRVLDFSRFAPDTGEREPIGSAARAAPALWNLATWAGRRSVVVGLWATHPAEPIDGLLVSDRLFGVLHVENEPPVGAVYPREREAEIRATLARVSKAVDLEALRRYLPDLTAEELARLGEGRAYDHPVTALRRILVETRVHDEIARTALDELRPDFALVYIQGTDSIGHMFAPFAPPRQPSISAADFTRYAEVPARYFEEIDALLGRYRVWAEANRATLAVVSDHGFHWSEGRPERLSSIDNSTAAKWHRSEGVGLFVSNAPELVSIPHGVEGAPAGIRRLAATFAALTGIPGGRDLAGPPLVGGDTAPDAVESKGDPIDYGAMFAKQRARETESGPAAATGEAESEALAELRALGYLGSAEPARRPEGAGGADATRTGGSWNNESLILKQMGRRAEAAAAFEQALALDPALPSALWNLSDLRFEDGDRPRSDELLVRALAAGFVDGERQVVQRALADHRAGRTENALVLLDRALVAKPGSRELLLFRGRFRMDRERCAAALEDFRSAEALAPADPAAASAAGIAQLCLGQEAAALASFRRSLALDPRQPPIVAYVDRLTRGGDSRPR